MKKRSFLDMAKEALKLGGSIIKPVKQPDPPTYADILNKPVPDAAELQARWTTTMQELKDSATAAARVTLKTGYPDYVYQPPPPQPKPVTVEMPLDQFSQMPCKSAGEILTVLKMRERLKGTDMDKYDRMTIEIRGDKVEVTFRASLKSFADAFARGTIYGYAGTRPELEAEMYAQKARIEAYKAQVQMNSQLAASYASAMAQQMANTIDRKILDSIVTATGPTVTIEPFDLLKPCITDPKEVTE